MRSSFRRSLFASLVALAFAAFAMITSAPASAATFNWAGGTSFWDIVTNWSSNPPANPPALPGLGDDVVCRFEPLGVSGAIQGQVAVIDFQCQGGSRCAVDAAPLGAVGAVVGVPASRGVAPGTLAADDLIADAGIPPRPGVAAVLVHGEGAVVPIVEIVRASVRGVLE